MSADSKPSPSENLATGLVGILLYIVIIYYSVWSISMGFRSKSTKRFFGTVAVMAVLELPRFFALAITQDYTSRTAYSFHIAAGVFFFLAFSIVCRQWSGLLQLGSYFRVVYGFHSLIVSNVAFAVVDLISIICCGLSSSLEAYFNSTSFEVITFIEGLRNVVYSAFLCYYGIKLVRRFWHFSTVERQAALKGGAVVSRLARLCPNWPFLTSDDQVFTKVVLRLTSVLLLSTFCFAVRVLMLIAKMALIHDNSHNLGSASFKLFGFGWFLFSDFIPRALPSLAFIFLMRTKKPRGEGEDASLANSPSESGTGFQFIRMTGQPYKEVKGFDDPRGASTEAFLQQNLFDEEVTEVTLNRIHEVEATGEVQSDDEDTVDPGEVAIDRIFSLLRMGQQEPA